MATQPPSPRQTQQQQTQSPLATIQSRPTSSPHPSPTQHAARASPGPDVPDVELDAPEVFEDFIERDVTSIAQQFRTAYVELMKTTARPNVLVAGTTGAGKSSLINAVFGRQLAQEGAGEPITTHFTRYAPDDARVVIYDSRGLEHGNTDAFIESTRLFFQQLEQGGSLADSIHVVWYVINGAGSRIQPFEEELVKTLFSKVPLFFLINKADISSDEDRAILRQTLTTMNLPSCAGIYDTVSGSHEPLLNVTKCPKCGSDDINIRKKKGIATCEACQTTISLSVNKEDFVAKTLEMLPAVAREAFIAAQTFSVMVKENRAKLIIREYYESCSSIRFAKTLLKEIARMLVRLAMLWDFREHGSTLGTELAQDLLRRELSFRDKLVFFLRKCKGERDRTAAVGVLWNRALRKIFITIFIRCADVDLSGSGGDDAAAAATRESCNWHGTVQASFQDLNEAELTAVEEEINKKGIEAVLEREMPMGRQDYPFPLPLSGTLPSPHARMENSPTPTTSGVTSPMSTSTTSIPPLQSTEIAPAVVAAAATALAAAAAATAHSDRTMGSPQSGRRSSSISSAEQPPLPPPPSDSHHSPPHRENSGPQQLQMRKTTSKEKDKDKGSLRLDPADIAEIEQAARLESEQTAMQLASELESAKKRSSLTASQSSLLAITDDRTSSPRSRPSLDGGRPPLRPTASVPIPIAGSGGPAVQTTVPVQAVAVSLPTTSTLFQRPPPVFVVQAPPVPVLPQTQTQPVSTLLSVSEPPKPLPMAPVQAIPQFVSQQQQQPLTTPPPPSPSTTQQPPAQPLLPLESQVSMLSTSPRYTNEEGAHGDTPRLTTPSST